MTSKEIAKKLNESILVDQRVLDFKVFYNLLQENDDLRCLEFELKKLQKQIVQLRVKNSAEVDDVIKIYEQKKSLFFDNPIVVNYQYCLDEVDILLQNINNYINNEIKVCDNLD